MYARRPSTQKQRAAQFKKWDAPTLGWVSNRALSDPGTLQNGQGAAILDNFFPRASTVQLRRGKQLYATLGDETLPATSLFSYNAGENQKMFGATSSTVYDLTNIIYPANENITTEDDEELGTEDGDYFGWTSTGDFAVYTGLTGGYWNTVQFATTGDIFLIGVNGSDVGFIYDGDDFWPNVAGGIGRVNFDAQTANFTIGAVVTGATSAATGTIYKQQDAGATGTLFLRDVTGNFQDNEIVAGGGGSATVNGASIVSTPGVTFPGGLTSADMSFVWTYANRLWFVQKDSLNAYYLPVDQVGGTAVIFPLAGVFAKGGSLMWGAAWSLQQSGQGGLSEQCVFVSTEGEVAVYQGINPGEADGFSRVGVYRIGRPLGDRAFMRGGGDLAIATSVGLVPLSKAIELDITSLNTATVSYNIADAWSDAISQRGMDNWQCELWPDQKIAVISPPNLIGADNPVMFVSNTETGAWCRYTNWQGLCLEVFRGQLYFGGPGGKIFAANVGGLDDGEAYTGVVMPLFEDLGSPASTKVAKVARVVTRSNVAINDQVSWHSDFDLSLPAPPDATTAGNGNTWGTGIWGQATWGAVLPSVISETWRSIGGLGYSISVAFQVTSGALEPIDVEMIRMDSTYTVAELVT